MKRTIKIIASLLFITTVFAGCTAPHDLPDAHLKSNFATADDVSWDDIVAKGTITIGYNDDNPPYAFHDESGKLVGFEIDLANAAAKEIGINIEFKTVTLGNLLNELSEGEIDLIWSNFRVTEERQEKILFTKPYIENSKSVITLKGSDIITLEDLKNANVGASGNPSLDDAINTAYEAGIANITRYNDEIEAIDALDNGIVDAVIIDNVLLRYYNKARNHGGYTVLEENFGMDVFAVAARQTEKFFVVELQKAIDTIKSNGIASDISFKWFNDDLIK